MKIFKIKPNVNSNFKAIAYDKVPKGKCEIRKDFSVYCSETGNKSYTVYIDGKEGGVCWDDYKKYLVWDDSIPPFTEGFMPVALTKREFMNLFTIWEESYVKTSQ